MPVLFAVYGLVYFTLWHSLENGRGLWYNVGKIKEVFT